MTASSDYTVQQRRIVDALQPLLGGEATALYEAQSRSLQRLVHFARQASLPACQRLATGLTVAQELLTEELALRSVFASPAAVTDYLKLHFAWQPYESVGGTEVHAGAAPSVQRTMHPGLPAGPRPTAASLLCRSRRRSQCFGRYGIATRLHFRATGRLSKGGYKGCAH